MRIRENRPTIQDSISKTLEVEGREQMVRHIFDTLRKKGVVVTDFATERRKNLGNCAAWRSKTHTASTSNPPDACERRKRLAGE